MGIEAVHAGLVDNVVADEVPGHREAAEHGGTGPPLAGAAFVGFVPELVPADGVEVVPAARASARVAEAVLQNAPYHRGQIVGTNEPALGGAVRRGERGGSGAAAGVLLGGRLDGKLHQFLDIGTFFIDALLTGWLFYL